MAAPRKRILLVAHEGPMRDALEAMLVQLKYQVDAASLLDEALPHIVWPFPTDVVILDLPPEEARRFRQAQKLNSTLANVPLVAVGDPSEVEAEAHVPRPLDSFVLYETLNRMPALADSRAAPADAARSGMENLPSFLQQELRRMADRLPGLAARVRELNPGAAEIEKLTRQTLLDAATLEFLPSYLQAFGGGAAEVIAPLDIRKSIDTVLAAGLPHIVQRAAVHRHFADVPPVIAKDAMLGQVFSCLIINAAQAIPIGNPARHRIDITTRTQEGWAVAEVRDTGTGIPEELLPRIFEPFFSTKRGLGLGLGLFVVRNIVTMLGGHIAVETEVGRGSNFRVSLPPAPPAPGDIGR